MVVRGKTTNPSPPSKAPIRGAGISISCHERKATEGSEFTWGEYENVFCRTDAQGTRMPWSHNTLNIFQLRCVPVENLKKKKAFIFVLARLSLKDHSLSYFYGDTKDMTHPPFPLKNPCHPKHNAIFQGKTGSNSSMSRNQDELIILQNLLPVIF